MYRGNVGNNCGCNKNASRYRHNEPVCGDVVGGYAPEEEYERDYYEDGCERDRFPIGMCYVPWQRFKDLYENEFAALANGTLFKELDLNWYGRGCK